MDNVITEVEIDLLNASPHCLIVLTPEFQVISLSERFKDDYKLESQEFIGMDLTMCLTKIFAQTHVRNFIPYQKMQIWMKANQLHLSDKLLKKEFSQSFPGVIYSTVIKAEELACIIISISEMLLDGLILDISERESTLQCMVDATDTLIAIVDNFGKLEFRNAAWERFTGGYMPKQGRFQWDVYIHEQELDFFQALLYEAIVKQSGFTADFRMRNYAGQYKWLHVVGIARITDQGRFCGYICTAIDITQIKEQISDLAKLNTELSAAHAQLKMSKEELQAAFDAAEMGSCSLDLATLKAEMSLKYRQHYGLPLTGEIDWQMVIEAVDIEYRDEINRVLMDSATKGAPVDSIYPIHHLVTGEKKWMRVLGKVRKDEYGNPHSVYAVVIDVTKRIEEENRKNRFIAMISHELKTPLTSVNSYIQLLEHNASKNAGVDTGKVYAKIRSQLKKMNRLIGGFLNVSRLESGKLEIVKSTFDLGDLLRSLKDEFCSEISTHEIKILSTSEVRLYADRDRIFMVVHNLLSNAVKYAPLKSAIVINYGKLDHEVMVTVSDEGNGLREEEKEKLFERYFKSEIPSMETIAGFGIGLFLCSEIIKLHGGKIWADNRRDIRGAIFGFSLPI